MEKLISTEVLVNASPEKIWSILTNFEDYSNWNPFIKFIEGRVAQGNRIKVRIEPPGASGMTFKPTVLTMQPHQMLTWLGHFLIKGLFDGEHRFELVDQGNGTTLFKHSEKFNGLLVPLFAKQLDDNTRRGFEQMNQRLKAIAEA
ncbi:MAG: hypothetical protein RL660_1510 [Bacteroidota bacterium]|jgi:hypothetical protein